MSLSDFSKDIDTIIKYFRKKFNNIYLIGYSFGCLNILLSKEWDFDKFILLDPSYKISFLNKKDPLSKIIYEKNLEKYITLYGLNYILSRELVEELENIDWKNLGKNIKKSFKIFSAEKSVLQNSKNILKKIPQNIKSDFEIIKNDDHLFSSNQKILFKKIEIFLK